MMKRLIVLGVCVSLLAGCATSGSNYVPLIDTRGTDPHQVQRDTTECQQFAKQRMDAATGAVAGAIVGALLGAALAPRGHRNYVAGYGATAGALGGGLGANENQQTIIKRCMAGRGYNVLN